MTKKAKSKKPAQKAKPKQPEPAPEVVRQGRPRVYATELPVYDSMEQCAGATKVPLSTLQFAKKSGCLFIRHGRVHFSEFVEWFFNQPTDGGENENSINWTNRDKRAAALLKEIALEEARHNVINWDKVERFLNYLVAVGFFGQLDRLANEFPARLKGKDEIGINQECLAEIKHIKSALKNSIEIWIQKKGNS